MKYIGYTTSFIALVFINAIINGWVFSTLWSWFISGTFGLPELSIPVAIGIALTVSFLTTNGDIKAEEKGAIEIMVGELIKSVLKCLTAVGGGWVVLQFV